MKLIIDIDEDYVKIINKNGASNYPEEVIKNGTSLEDVLYKIKAEIEILSKTYPFVNHIDTYVKEDDVKKIIDKYRERREK